MAAKKNRNRGRAPSRRSAGGNAPTPSFPPVIEGGGQGRESAELTRVSSLRFEIGPIPSPEVLAQYRETDPRIVDAILHGFVQQQDHRREQEREGIATDRMSRRRGQIMGWGVATLALLVAGAVGIYGSPWAAIGIVSVGVGAPIVAVIRGSRERQRTNGAP